ncbi:MAG TPA: acyl-CoA dehydrogenase family protein, partial [Flavisolibacter sp.]|nr:acyl-CoA dehydrogenase family protein [Flavisolibacter sp.]
METTISTTLKGGEWLVKESEPQATFIPEEFTEEQKMIRDMCDQFLRTEVMPNVERMDKMEPGYMRSLVEKAGGQGMLAVAFPEEYGGMGKDFVTSTIVNEYLGAGHSFSVAISAHTGIGTLPILYFGTEEQKSKYIPKLINGEWVGAY